MDGSRTTEGHVKRIKPGQPPDGGWGWLVVAGGMYSLAMWGGIMRCYSVFYAPMMSEFNVEYGTVSWLNGMFQISYGLSTCLVPVAMKKFNQRKMSLMAAAVCGASAFLASFCTQLWQVQVLLGLVVGVMMGAISITAFTVTTRYFKKHLHTANQLLCLGVSAGPLLLCPGYQYLINSFGWRGACQIVAGLLLNMSVASALMRPIKLDSDYDSPSQESASDHKGPLKQRPPTTEDLAKPKVRDLNNLGAEIVGSQSIGLYTPTPQRKTFDDIAYLGSETLLDASANELSRRSFKGSHVIDCDLPYESAPAAISHKEGLLPWLKGICIKYDLVLLADPVFYVYTFSWVGFAAAYFSAFTYIIPYGREEMGLSKIEASTLVSAFAGGEIFSRLVYTLVFDRLPERFRILYISILFGLYSMAVLLFPFLSGFLAAMACCALIGALGGGTDGIFAVFIVEIYHLKQYPAVFGYSNIITHGTGTAATVLIGGAADRYGNLAVPFYIGCGTAATSSAMAFLLHKVVSRRRRMVAVKAGDEKEDGSR